MYLIKPITKIIASINVPPDKSISHRALMLSAIANGQTKIEPFIASQDALATLDCLKQLGVKIKRGKKSVIIYGRGKYFNKTKLVKLFARQSGTTLRILSGLLIGQKFPVVFDSSPELRKRPMARITLPLRKMGADITGKKQAQNEYPPIKIKPVEELSGINYTLPIASAQIKTAIIFAGLYAKTKTIITEPLLSRDHTERILAGLNGPILKKGKKIIISPLESLKVPSQIFIPGDFSSAAFFIVLGLILKDSEILLKNVNINPSRTGLLKVLNRMGANIVILKRKDCLEPYADIVVESSNLKGTVVRESEIPLMIDEIPILAVAASFAKGKTLIKRVKELKVKETDRINSMVYNLKKAGINIKAYTKSGDWQMEIIGQGKFNSANFKSFSDHRTAMSMIIFAMASNHLSNLDDITCIDKSFPEFISIVEGLKCTLTK